MIAVLAPSVAAQEPCRTHADGEGRPAIGLALSGGGARGLAHMGALRALEELGIPIDCVAGTSMGAVVGGMYSLGMSPEEIEAEVSAIDFADMFRGSAARKDLSFRRKEDERKFLFGAEIGITEDGIRFPRGTVSSLSLDFFLETLSLRAGSLEHFDDLEIPFRAVASDVRSGRVVVMQDGELSTAIRASMAVPGVLAPIERGPYSLVDGGMLENLPVAAVRQMGADVVIAIDVASPVDPEDVFSATSIAARALSLALENRNEAARDQADVLVRPELGKMSPLDFAEVEGPVDRGREAVAVARPSLSRYREPEAFARFLERQRRAAPPLPVIRSIRIEGESRVVRARIEKRIRTKVGEVLDLERLHDDLARINTIGEFSSVRFLFEPPLENGDLVIEVEDKSWGPYYLRLGLGFSDDLEGSNSLSARLNLTRTSLNRLGAEWRSEIQTGRTRGLTSELFLPLDYSERWFVAPRIEGRREVQDIYDERDRIAELDVRTWTVGADFGWQWGKYGEFRLGLRRGLAEREPRVGDLDLERVEAETGAYVGRVVVDRLDSAAVPRRGLLADFEGYVSDRSLGAEDEYEKAEAEIQQYFTRGRHTGLLALAGGSSLGSDPPDYDQFRVGGLFSFSGYSVGELRGNYYGVARAGYLYRIYDLPVAFGTAIYLGGWLEGGDVWQRAADAGVDDLRGSITLAVAIDTRFGPVYVAHGVADDGEGQYYLRLGSSF